MYNLTNIIEQLNRYFKQFVIYIYINAMNKILKPCILMLEEKPGLYWSKIRVFLLKDIAEPKQIPLCRLNLPRMSLDK